MCRWVRERQTTPRSSGSFTVKAFAQGFRGVMPIEYEHDSPELMEEVAQCIAFVEKTVKSLLS
jgi:hypothetical protein